MAQLRKASVISLSAGDIPTATEISIKLRHPSLERQDSVEILDDLMSSTSSVSGLTPKKVKKKRHLSVFHRHKSSKGNSSPLDGYLGTSLPVQHHTNGNSLQAAQDDSHLSLEGSWNQGSWNQLRKNSSLHSSNLSLLSVESEGRELSDEELVESLVYPRGSQHTPSPPPLELPASEGGNSMEYAVNVTLMSGHSLAIRDRTGCSDPYVKFKCPPFKYRSAIKHRNLNPEWNEHFSFRTQNLATPMLVRVYDHDYGSLDDYMGGQTLDLAAYAKEEQHILNMGLEDPAIKHENLGFLRIYLKITPATSDNGTNSPAKEEKKHKPSSSKVWSSVLTVTLLEGSNFPPMDQNGLSDPYCKFKLGSQKYKSKAQSKTLNPKWMRRFDLRMYDDCSILYIEVWDKDFPQNDDFIGMCSVKLCDVHRDQDHDFVLPLEDRNNAVDNTECTIHFKLCITATKVDDKEETAVMENIDSYGILSTLDLKAIKERNVGHLCIKIDKAVDLIPCSCFVLMELGNSCVRTHPVGKSANPVWNKAFEFTVGDIHDELEVMVYKAGSRSDYLLGKVKIPLHRLRKGCQQFVLKDKHCLSRTRGVLYIETALVYNPVRAMIRTINPKEDKLLEGETKFKKKVLMNNIKRVSNLVRTVLSIVEFIETTWSWENKPLSMIAFLLFMVVTIFGELWMALFIGVVVFFYQYVTVLIRNDHVWQNRIVHEGSSTNQYASFDSHEDSDFSDSVEDKHTSLREKFRQFQEILVLVQVYLGIVADIEEGVKNLLNWSVPFLSWMAILVFSGGAVLFYMVPIRYVVLVWGINKYTKRLRKPNFISNNELIDFISRCPTNKQLHQWRELPIHQKSVSEGKGNRKRDTNLKKTK